eukprot:399258-Prorocentrum_minimum.AAC.2
MLERTTNPTAQSRDQTLIVGGDTSRGGAQSRDQTLTIGGGHLPGSLLVANGARVGEWAGERPNASWHRSSMGEGGGPSPLPTCRRGC